MAALQPLAVAMPLSTGLRLALHPHAASGTLAVFDDTIKTRSARALRVFFLLHF